MEPVLSVLPSLSTSISSGETVCDSTESSVARIVFSPLYAGITTLTFMLWPELLPSLAPSSRRRCVTQQDYDCERLVRRRLPGHGRRQSMSIRYGCAGHRG